MIVFLRSAQQVGRSAEQLRIRNSYKWDPRNRIVTKSMMGILFYVQTFAKAREKGAYGAGSPDGDLGRDCGIYRMSVRKF